MSLVELTNNEDKSALYSVVSMGNLPLTLLLIQFVVTDESLGDLSYRQKLIKQWINNKETCEEYGYSVLHEAAVNDNFRIL